MLTAKFLRLSPSLSLSMELKIHNRVVPTAGPERILLVSGLSWVGLSLHSAAPRRTIIVAYASQTTCFSSSCVAAYEKETGSQIGTC